MSILELCGWCAAALALFTIGFVVGLACAAKYESDRQNIRERVWRLYVRDSA